MEKVRSGLQLDKPKIQPKGSTNPSRNATPRGEKLKAKVKLKKSGGGTHRRRSPITRGGDEWETGTARKWMWGRQKNYA